MSSSARKVRIITKRFVVEVCLNSQVIGKGSGKSKKEAEQLAAKEALELMGYEAQ